MAIMINGDFLCNFLYGCLPLDPLNQIDRRRKSRLVHSDRKLNWERIDYSESIGTGESWADNCF